MKKELNSSDFLQNKLTLHSPDQKEIGHAYKNLPETGHIEVLCSFASLSSTLNHLENNNFFGITILKENDWETGVQIIAFKGKELPCYDTGKSAVYSGSALAALDDDLHLLCDETRICEKTAVIYDLPVYRKRVKVSKGDPDLRNRLIDDPVPFDCDTFEEKVNHLNDHISEFTEKDESTAAILYPGPFKLLILQDGIIIRRGVPACVPFSVARQLRKSDGCVFLEGKLAEYAVPLVNFNEVFQKYGPLCLLNFENVEIVNSSARLIHFDRLKKTSAEMKRRLVKMIETGSEYFIIVGSDTRDLEGCCPSGGVTEANRLVEAGILQVARPGSQANTCPINIYAFAGEMREGDIYPSFEPDQKLRQKVYQFLNQPARGRKEFIRTLLRWSLLLFAGFSLMTMIVKNFLQNSEFDEPITTLNLVKEFNVPFQNGILILQFHRSKRCDFCNNMEKHTRTALNQLFADEMEKRLAFRTVNMDLRRFKPLRKKYELFTSTLVFIRLKNGEQERSKIVTEAWSLTNHEDKFVQMIQSELKQFMSSGQ